MCLDSTGSVALTCSHNYGPVNGQLLAWDLVGRGPISRGALISEEQEFTSMCTTPDLSTTVVTVFNATQRHDEDEDEGSSSIAVYRAQLCILFRYRYSDLSLTWVYFSHVLLKKV